MTIVLAVVLLFAAPSDPEPWKATCERLKDVAIPAGDRPDDATTTALTGCSADDLYYGIGIAADPVKARHCAILEVDAGVETVFGGKTVLMQVYANGRGVERNLDLAIRMACAVGWAPAENEARVGELEQMKTLGAKARVDFDLCDHTTSGYMGGHCAAHAARMKAVGRNAKVASLTKSWSAADKQAFAVLRKAADAWIAARSGDEVDLSGSARAAFVVSEEEKQEVAFAAFLETLERAPGDVSGTSSDLAAADRALNASYKAIMAAADFSYGTVTKDGIKKTERAWMRYRDAWIAFAKKKYPNVPADAINAQLTADRDEMLRDLLPRPE